MPISPSTAGSVTISTTSEYTTAPGVTISSFKVSATSCPRSGHILDAALHVEIVFRNSIVLAVENLLEAAHGIGDRHLLAFTAREDLRDAERLAQEPLNLSRPIDGHLVVRRQLVDAENGDDVLQILEALQHLLDAARRLIMLVADDFRGQGARGRRERVDRWVDS